MMLKANVLADGFLFFEVRKATLDIFTILTAKKQILCGSDFADGACHLAVHIFIFNEKGEMLIQQRQPFKEDS